MSWWRLGVCALVLAAPLPSSAQVTWILVGKIDGSAQLMAKELVQRTRAGDQGTVVNLAECGSGRVGLAWAARSFDREKEAQKELEDSKRRNPGMRIVECEQWENTLLAHGISAVDASIAEVPSDAVNWSEEDRISELKTSLKGGRVAVIRYFNGANSDPLEGRREKVMFLAPKRAPIVVRDSCVSPDSFFPGEGYWGFSCAREPAGNTLLHDTIVVDDLGKILTVSRNCRTPSAGAAGWFKCQREEVDSSGQLLLQPIKVMIPGVSIGADGVHAID